MLFTVPYDPTKQYLNSMEILIAIILPTGPLRIPISHGSNLWKVQVLLCGGIWSQGVIGPYLFNSTAAGQSYLEMLNDYFYPIFCQLPGNESTALNQETAFCVFLDYE
jgi:hypothetical protein